MAKIIGLTGGIGSGKTTIANYIKTLGIPVYNSDDKAREISERPEIIEAIKTEFGYEILNNDKIDRKKLTEIVFNNPEKLNKLNGIIHPAVLADFTNWVQKHTVCPIVIKEAAILFESGSYKDCDFVITVIAPKDVRIERVIARDTITEEQVLRTMKNQWTDEQRMARSDYVIDNLNITEVKEEISKILKILINS